MIRHLNIGRLESNDIVLNGRYVSDMHAIIDIDHEDYFITDLGSIFGTFVNGERITGKTQISKKDKIKIGNVLVDWVNYIMPNSEDTDEGIYFDDLFTSQGRISKSEYTFLIMLILSSPIVIIGGIPMILKFLEIELDRRHIGHFDLMIYNKPIWIISYIVIGFIFLLQTKKRIKTINENKMVTEHNHKK